MTPIFLQLLADRHGTPAGLMLAADPVPAGLADAFGPPLAQLAAGFPCHFRAGGAGAATPALEAAGWLPLPAGRLLRTDAAPVAQLPPGVDWIEGDWPLAPPARAVASPGAGNQAASRALALQLVQLVNEDADTHAIEDLLRRDPTLSYHLLRLVNSLGIGAGRKVTSFSQAILLLGRQQLRRWLNLMLFAAREGDVRSAMLLARVSVRSRLMELLARATGLDKANQEQAFMAGMFSLLGVLFGAPLTEVLAPLAIGDAVRRALLDRQGELGALLALVEAAERGDFRVVATQLDAVQLPADEFNAMVLDATQWMLDMLHGSQDKGRSHA